MRDTIWVANHLSLNEVKMRMQRGGSFLRVLKWLVIYNALVDPRPISEIARHTGLSEGTVRRVLAEYNSRGPEYFECLPKAVTHPKEVVEEHMRVFASR
ncbi:MAG: helix-turn-helix domain-containing protein [Syntrophobacteraceae bacterium]